MLAAATARPRRLSKADKAAFTRGAQAVLLEDVAELECRAHDLGMHTTARALNNAKNALGWELAGEPLKAGKAARGVRVFRKRSTKGASVGK